LTQNLQDIDDENKETCQKTNIIVAIHITNEQKYCAFELFGIFKNFDKIKDKSFSKSKGNMHLDNL
jgi:hypothetical protein